MRCGVQLLSLFAFHITTTFDLDLNIYNLSTLLPFLFLAPLKHQTRHFAKDSDMWAHEHGNE